MRFLACSALLTAALLAGCEKKVPVPKPTAKDVPVVLKPVTVAELDQFLESQKGKVVLVDCWSLN